MPLENKTTQSKNVHPQLQHLGEWRSASKNIFYCARLFSPSECDGILCFHDNDMIVSHWSCCGSKLFEGKGCLGEMLDLKTNSVLDHIFVNQNCKICTKCYFCTMFGKRCCKVVDRDRSIDRGKECGCGSGDSGCKYCGVCRSCSSESTCISKDGDHAEFQQSSVIERSATEDPNGAIAVGTHILCQWRRSGGSVYPGVVTCVHSDGTMDVKYDDGDQDDRVSSNRISVTAPVVSGDLGSSRALSADKSASVEVGSTNMSSPRAFFRSSLHASPFNRDLREESVARQPSSMSSINRTTSTVANSDTASSSAPSTSSGLSAWLRGIAEPGAGLRGQLGAFENQLEQLAHDFRGAIDHKADWNLTIVF